MRFVTSHWQGINSEALQTDPPLVDVEKNLNPDDAF